MKKFISVLLAVCLAFTSLFPVSALADSKEYLVVTRDNAPIRTGPGEKNSVVARCQEGTMLETTGSTLNWYLNRWYKVLYKGESYYIFSGNVDKHEHDYEKYEYDGVKYAICPECGSATVTLTERAKISKADAYAIPNYVGVGLGLGALDGPLPAADVIGVAIAGLGILYSVTTPTKEVAIEITQDLAAYMNESPAVCSDDSFYWVTRSPAGLTKVDGKCLTIPEAYALIRAGCDVWTEYESTARTLAYIYGSCYSEIDSNGYGGPKPGYYYHYHLGADRKHKVTDAGHIFYGVSAVTGLRPQ